MDIPEIDMDYELYLDLTRAIPKGSSVSEVLNASCILAADNLSQIRNAYRKDGKYFDKQEWLDMISEAIGKLMENFEQSQA